MKKRSLTEYRRFSLPSPSKSSKCSKEDSHGARAFSGDLTSVTNGSIITKLRTRTTILNDRKSLISGGESCFN
ncbi:unnamed protein product [Amaranthus hypochondriacus]